MDPKEGVIPSHLFPLSVSLFQHCPKLKLTLDLGARDPGLLKTWISLSLKDERIEQKAELVKL